MTNTGFFDIISSYDNTEREEFFSGRIRDEAIIQLKTESGRTAADIGAGKGFITEGLLDAGLKVTAVDSSPIMIEYMKERFADIREFTPFLTDKDFIKLADDYADYAFAHMYLHHTEDPQTALNEIIRILKPGGKAAVTDFIFHSFEDHIKNHFNRWPGFTFPDIYDWFIAAGFKNISIEKLSHDCFITSPSGEDIKIGIFIACGEK